MQSRQSTRSPPGPGRNRRRAELWEGQDEKSKRGPRKKEGFDRCLRMSVAEMHEKYRASAEVRKEGFVWGNGKKISCSFAPYVKGSLVLRDRRKRNKCVRVCPSYACSSGLGPRSSVLSSGYFYQVCVLGKSLVSFDFSFLT